jgi:hypothetical protein
MELCKNLTQKAITIGDFLDFDCTIHRIALGALQDGIYHVNYFMNDDFVEYRYFTKYDTRKALRLINKVRKIDKVLNKIDVEIPSIDLSTWEK